MDVVIRPAITDDHCRLNEIAVEGDATGDSNYLAFVASTGRLLCAESDGVVVGFGGVLPIDGIAMVTDLFVARMARAMGVGSRLLTELLTGWSQRMTFSGQHPAALAAYRRAGMQPRHRMLYLQGRASGGGQRLLPSIWPHGRDDLVGYFAQQGATVTANAVVAIGATGVEVLRLDSANAVDQCRELLAAFEAGTSVRLYVPESHELAGWLLAHGFTVTDYDVLCTSERVALPTTLAIVHPGLL